MSAMHSLLFSEKPIDWSYGLALHHFLLFERSCVHILKPGWKRFVIFAHIVTVLFEKFRVYGTENLVLELKKSKNIFLSVTFY